MNQYIIHKAFEAEDDEEYEIIDCTEDSLQHAVISTSLSTAPSGTVTGQWISSDRRTGMYAYTVYTDPKSHSRYVNLEIKPKNGVGTKIINAFSVGASESKIKQVIKNHANGLTDEECSLIASQINKKVNQAFNQHAGYYSPNLRHAAIKPESAFKPGTVAGQHVYIPDKRLRDRPGYIGLACYSDKDHRIDVYVPINQITRRSEIGLKFALALKAKDKLGTFRAGTMDDIAEFFDDILNLRHTEYTAVNESESLKHFGILGMKLGFSNVKASEMTQADWDRLNAEIKDLRAVKHSAYRSVKMSEII